MTLRKLTANKRPDGFFDLSQLSRGFQSPVSNPSSNLS